MTHPQITVAIPSLPARGQMLIRALRSVARQTLPAAAVSVAVDVSQSGAAATRQRALDGVTTEWVALLDDDDAFKAEHLAKLYAHAMETGADYCYCVDPETEIMTADGWRTYDQIAVGDVVLTLNHETGMSEWQPLKAVNVFPAREREMILMQSRDHSSLTTPGHRWPVETSRPGKDWAGYEGRAWRTTDSFKSGDRVPIAAECADLAVEAKYEDALVELVAWFWTEGHIHTDRKGRKTRTTSLCQSVKNESNCVRIRSALTRLFGPSVAAMPRTGSGPTDGVPRWRESLNKQGLRSWHLSVDAGDLITAHAPGRVVRPGFIRSLTRAQLTLFIEVSMLADNNGFHSLSQKDRAASEAFQFAVTLLGMASSFREHVDREGRSMWQVRMRSTKGFTQQHLRKSRIMTVGEIWCPTTENGTWLARRRGTMYFTGNSWFDMVGGIDPFPSTHITNEFDPTAEIPPETTVTVLVRTGLAKSVGYTPLDRGHNANSGEDYGFLLGCIAAGAIIRNLNAGRTAAQAERTWYYNVHGDGKTHGNTSGLPTKGDALLWTPTP